MASEGTDKTAIDPSWRLKARLCAKELAAVASESLRTVRAKIASGEIESYKDGAKRYIPIAAALAYLHEHVPESVPRPIESDVDRDAREFLDRFTQGVG